MTNREALEILLAGYYNNANYQELIEAREKLEKDLKVLEILKKHYDKDSLVVSIGRFISFYIYNEDTDFKKVKEWLENEKDNI